MPINSTLKIPTYVTPSRTIPTFLGGALHCLAPTTVLATVTIPRTLRRWSSNLGFSLATALLFLLARGKLRTTGEDFLLPVLATWQLLFVLAKWDASVVLAVTVDNFSLPRSFVEAGP